MTGTDLSEVDDDEARRLVDRVEEVKRAFERFVAEDVVPNISQAPTRVGVVETVRLFTSEHSMNTDYLLLLSGVLSGTGGVLDQITEKYTVEAAEELGRFSQQPVHQVGD